MPRCPCAGVHFMPCSLQPSRALHTLFVAPLWIGSPCTVQVGVPLSVSGRQYCCCVAPPSSKPECQFQFLAVLLCCAAELQSCGETLDHLAYQTRAVQYACADGCPAICVIMHAIDTRESRYVTWCMMLGTLLILDAEQWRLMNSGGAQLATKQW